MAGIEAACTVLLDDPLFGLIAFGGEVTQTNPVISVIPRDGVRQRFHALIGRRRLHLTLDRDGFAAEQPLRVSPTLGWLDFSLENRSPAPHTATLVIEGLPPGQYSVVVAAVVRSFRASEERGATIALPLELGRTTQVRIEGAAAGTVP